MTTEFPIFLPGELVRFHPTVNKTLFNDGDVCMIIGISFIDDKGRPTYDILHEGGIKTVYWDWLLKCDNSQ